MGINIQLSVSSRIINNVVYSNTDIGVHIMSSSGNMISNNRIYRQSGGNQRICVGVFGNNNIIRNNQLFGNMGGANMCAGLYLGSARNNYVANNNKWH